MESLLHELDHLENDFDIVEYFQGLLIDFSTGRECNTEHYEPLREYFLSNPNTKDLVPRWIRVNRNLDQFWQFIKNKYGTYAERRQFIWSEFNPLLEYLEGKQRLPPEKSISQILKRFDHGGVHFAWQKALERKTHDPEGAITLARTILESVCKNILDDIGVEYNAETIKLSKLYKLTAKELNLAPENHSDEIFKQILGGCSGIVNGLGSLRNKLGDAHGQGARRVRPAPRHAELAVNLSGSMALFLVETYINHKEQ